MATSSGTRASVGIIGMGEMGRMYAKYLRDDGRRTVYVCDRPENYDKLVQEWKDVAGVKVLKDGHLVSRISDFIIYSVEAEYIERVVSEFGPSTKVGAIVAGQTSVKAPEREAFERHLPTDVSIISLHSLHGPSINPSGQALILIRHRGSESELKLVEEIVAPLKSRLVHLTYEEHDEVTANTQAVTHAAFLSMGTAWHSAGSFPWESGLYVRGIEVAKINITLRIYSSKWHVYAGLAILNPMAKVQIDQYAKSVTEIFKLMLDEREDELRERMHRARDFVFPSTGTNAPPMVFVKDEVFDEFAINTAAAATGASASASSQHQQHHQQRTTNGTASPPTSSSSSSSPPSNSHLSLLAIVDSWAQLRLSPYAHLNLAATPIFRLWFGVSEYLFRSQERLDAAIRAACYDRSHRSDDLEFTIAARGWSQCVSFGEFEAYRRRFERTADWFRPRFEEVNTRGAKMIKEILK